MVSGDVEAGFGELTGPVIASGEGVEVAGGVVGAPREDALLIVEHGKGFVVAGCGLGAAFDPPEQFKTPAVAEFGVGCGSCDVGEFGVRPLIGDRLGGSDGEGSCPGVVLRVQGDWGVEPNKAEGFCGSVEVELIPTHAPHAIRLGLSKEGVFWVVEDVPSGSV